MNNLVSIPLPGIIFYEGSGTPYDETESGHGGTQLASLEIMKSLARLLEESFLIIHAHSRRTKLFTGRSGINYAGKDLSSFHIALHVDMRIIRNSFKRDTKYIHWMHDDHANISNKYDSRYLSNYDDVIVLSETQRAEWERTHRLKNLRVINNPIVTEGISPSGGYDRFRLFCYSAKTNWEMVYQIISRLIKIDPRYKLYICCPSYSKPPHKDSDGIINLGCLSHIDTIKEINRSLCVLYPTTQQESFGYIFAESNYYKTPVLTNHVTGSTHEEMLTPASEQILPSKCQAEDFVNVIVKWNDVSNSRPSVSYKTSSEIIIRKWLDILV